MEPTFNDYMHIHLYDDKPYKRVTHGSPKPDEEHLVVSDAQYVADYFKRSSLVQGVCLNGSSSLGTYFKGIGVAGGSNFNQKLLKDKSSGGIGGFYPEYYYWEESGEWDCSKNKPDGYTVITFEQFINQQPKNQTDMSTTTNTTAAEKQLSITKTEVILLGKKKREVTITVLTTDFGRIRAGYAVRNPEDKKSDQDFAKQISTGRALSDKTTLVNYEYTQDLKKKFVLYAVAEQLFRDISYGKVEIKIGK